MPSITGSGIYVEFDAITSEKINRGGKLTSSPIEGNKTISDHFAKNPESISLSGVCTTNYATKYANIKKLYENAVLCVYSGRNIVTNCVITKFNTDHGGDVDKAFSFTMSITAVQISSTHEFIYQTGATAAQNAAYFNSVTNIGVNQGSTRNVDATTNVSALANALRLVELYSGGGVASVVLTG